MFEKEKTHVFLKEKKHVFDLMSPLMTPPLDEELLAMCERNSSTRTHPSTMRVALLCKAPEQFAKLTYKLVSSMVYGEYIDIS